VRLYSSCRVAGGSLTLRHVAKHAHASNMLVDVQAIDGGVRVSVSDDGVGGADPSCGSGLLGCETASTRSAGRFR
jgi:nitrate/nitrite-specific signal transduction histidine kinase